MLMAIGAIRQAYGSLPISRIPSASFIAIIDRGRGSVRGLATLQAGTDHRARLAPDIPPIELAIDVEASAEAAMVDAEAAARQTAAADKLLFELEGRTALLIEDPATRARCCAMAPGSQPGAVPALGWQSGFPSRGRVGGKR